MRIKGIITIVLLLFTVQVNAQGINNFWLSGVGGWYGRPFGTNVINYINNQPDTSWEARKMYFNCTNGVIADSAGNFLFSSNGQWIANAANDTMLNGNGLNPALYTTQQDSFGLVQPQANMILPKPNSNHEYYLFHQTVDGYGVDYDSYYLYYSLIDMNGDGGLGEVVDKNHVIINDSITNTAMSACKHANGRDWWIIKHENLSDRFITLLLTPDSIFGPYYQSAGIYRESYWAQCCFSPSGNYFTYYAPSFNDLDIFDFDRCSGMLTLKAHVDIDDSSGAPGVAFSPNNRFLYVASFKYIYQFDMQAANIPASQTTVAVWDSVYYPNYPFSTAFYLLQLMPDGKIYGVASSGTKLGHIINYPDSAGLACDVCMRCLEYPAYNNFTIPNYPNYFLGADTTSLVCDSLSSGMVNPGFNKLSLKVWPNPVVSGGSVQLNYNTLNQNGVLELLNTDGRLIKSYGLPAWSQMQPIQLPELPEGVYLLNLKSGERRGNFKVIVLK
ncbi:MAG: hypothetical protein RIQ89_75 [Bacteroidota bacterium]|jgi:hypothetical protein